MVEAGNKKCTVKHFPIDPNNSFVQYTIQVDEADYNNLTGQADAAANQNIGKNKILIQALDNSGSMSGAPIEALKVGAGLIGEQYFNAEQRPFEQFHTMIYNNNVDSFSVGNLDSYTTRINNIRAGGGTNFMNVFVEIEKVLRLNPDTEELVVIFITDGQDGYYSRTEDTAEEQYETISARIQSMPNLQTKFLSVGFSRGHDAAFMNRIANFGNSRGNFVFIDSYEEGWRDNLNVSMLDSLEIALESSAKVKFSIKNAALGHEESVKAEIGYHIRESEQQTVQPQQEAAVEEEKKEDDGDAAKDIFDIRLTYQSVVDQNLLTEQLVFKLVTNGVEHDIDLDFETVQDPQPELILRAKLEFNQKRMFNFIQELQQKSREERLAIYQQIKQIDDDCEQDQGLIRKVKDKDIRSSLMDSFLKFKQQTAQVYRIMGSDTHEQINNLLIAQLNDVAYKAIRKAGVQKKLDERAIKNDTAFKKSDAELNDVHSKINFDKVQAAQGAIMDAKIGNCPLSMSSVVELMQAKDCMCLGLAIARSQATISDPTKLVIKDVFPVYMSMDSFLESSIFNLKINQDAAGGFDLKEEGKLAVGAGREDISGLMPLYLFREHWDLAKRKVQPLFGFMCTLEPLGYASNQFFTIPYLVLTKALKKNIESPSESNTQIVELVQETCQRMIANNNTFKEQTVDSLIGFIENPANRTADILPDLQVHAAQVWSWNTLSEEEKKVQSSDPQAAEENKTVDPEMMKRYSRFAVEETIRRGQKNAQPLGKTQLLNLLVPDHAEIVNSFKSQVQTQAESNLESSAAGQDEYVRYKERADRLRAQAAAEESDSNAAQQDASIEEEKKDAAEEQKTDGAVKTLEQIVQEQITKSPWIAQMSKVTGSVQMNYVQNRSSFIKILSDLEGREAPYTDILEFFNGEQEILFATLLQNAMHPKNSDRTGAIKSGTYVEILTMENARSYISNLVKTHLSNELRAAESSVLGALAAMQTMADLRKLVEAPDVFIAAVALSDKAFYEGKGDRTSFFKCILDLNPSRIPDLGRKLKLVTSRDFMGIQLYNDKMCQPDRVNKQTIYQLWLHCCRNSNAVTIEKMTEFQPHASEQLHIYDRFVDNEGKTTLNMDEYMKFRADKKVEADNKKKANNAKKSGKMKL